jgi:uncharacterized protein
MTRPLVLIPSSKAKAQGGDGKPYGDSDALHSGPLADLRRDALDALQAAANDLDDAGVARLCGVKPADAPDHRAALAGLAENPTLPAHRRYTGVVHRFAGLETVAPADAGVDVAILGGLLGAAMLDEPVPDYRLEVTGRVPALGVLGTWWSHRLGEPLRALAGSRRVWDLLPGEFARLWPARERGDAAVIAVRFERADGRAAPSASAKVAKGELLRVLLDDPALGPDDLAGEQVLEGWRFERREAGLAATQTT